MGFNSGEEVVSGVWKGWIRMAGGAASSPAAIRREREAWIVRHVANKPGLRDITPQKAASNLAGTNLTRVKPFMATDAVNMQVASWHARESFAPKSFDDTRFQKPSLLCLRVVHVSTQQLMALRASRVHLKNIS